MFNKYFLRVEEKEEEDKKRKKTKGRDRRKRNESWGGWEIHLTAVVVDDESQEGLQTLLSPRIHYAYSIANARRQGAFAFGVARPGAKSIIVVVYCRARRPTTFPDIYLALTRSSLSSRRASFSFVRSFICSTTDHKSARVPFYSTHGVFDVNESKRWQKRIAVSSPKARRCFTDNSDIFSKNV